VSVAGTATPGWLAAWAAIEGRPDAAARRAAGWAAGRGARQLYLQVEEDNQPALRLYGRLGFRPSHRYHYRVTPAAAPSARPGPGG
jgi:ribosomal protein S18 acetylase RimI-like enzyme